MPNKIDDLREILFAQLARLNEDRSPEEIARAKAVRDVAGAITETARVEVDYLRATGANQGSGFIEAETKPREITKPPMAMINNSPRGRT